MLKKILVPAPQIHISWNAVSEPWQKCSYMLAFFMFCFVFFNSAYLFIKISWNVIWTITSC